MQNDCTQFQDLIAEYLAGGLSADEQSSLESHLATCPDCANKLRELQNLESDMTAMFATPDAMFESRLLHRLRLGTPSRIHPLVTKIATGLAASIVLAGFGYIAQTRLETTPVASSGSSPLSTPAAGIDDFRCVPQSPASDAPSTQPGEVMAGKLVAGERFYADRELSHGYFQTPSSNAERWDFRGGASITDGWTKLPQLGVLFRPGDLSGRGTNVRLEASRSGENAPQKVAGSLIVQSDAEKDTKPDQPVEGKAMAVVGVPVVPAEQTQAQVIQTKIIRNGEIEFEIDSFDSAAATVAKLVTEEGGYIGTTSSEKLPNGKVKGVLIVRVPPDRLDNLVLKLRGLGELKRQNLSANDVTKQYHDLSSELRAARAMQDRLMEIIKTGNAPVKDLLNVEKELATWRGKIEKLEGEIRYFDNLVSLSTLNISLAERDIRTAAAIKEVETADAGIEVADVETARSAAITAIEEAKGRIIEAELKKLDAGQFAAKVIADVPAEQAGSVIDRLKQIGKVARLEISRKQTTPDNSSPQAGAKVEKGDTRIVANFYNLANVAARQTITLQLAAEDVAKAYAAVLLQIENAKGRVITSNLQQPRPDETSGTIQFELPADIADQQLQLLQQAGLVLQMTVSENPDTANVTSAKRGFNLSLLSSRAIPPRQTVNITAETKDVAGVATSLSAHVQSLGGRIVDTTSSTRASGASSSSLKIELPAGKLGELMGKIASDTKIRSQQLDVRAQVPDGPAARALVELNLQSPDSLVSADSGFLASLRRGLSTSVAGLLWSLQLIIIGVCLVAPWLVLVWAGVKVWKKRRATA